MIKPYFCPVCRSNRTDFIIIYRLTRQVRKDPDTGDVTYQAPELEAPTRNGQPEVDVRCCRCGYTGHESLFIKAAARQPHHPREHRQRG